MKHLKLLMLFGAIIYCTQAEGYSRSIAKAGNARLVEFSIIQNVKDTTIKKNKKSPVTVSPIAIQSIGIQPTVINNGVTENTNTYMIVYDFAKHTYDTNMVHPKLNHPVVFKIKNINRLAYSVSISSRDSVLATTKNTDTIILKKAGQTAVPKDSLPKLPGQPATTIKFSDVNQPSDKNKKTIADDANKYLKNVGELETTHTNLVYELLEQKRKLPQFITDSTSNRTAFNTDDRSTQKSIDSLKNLIKAKENEIFTLTTKTEAIKDNAESYLKLKTAFILLRQHYQDIWDIYSLKDKIVNIATDPQLTFKKFMDTYANELDKYRGTRMLNNAYLIKQFYLDLANFNDIYRELANNNAISQAFNDTIAKDLKKPAEQLNNDVKALTDSLKKRNPRNDLKLMQNLVNWLFSESSFIITSTPIQPSQDLVVFDINIDNKPKATLNDAGRFGYREYVSGGMRYDFSTGIVFSFFVGDNTYSKKSATADSSFLVRNKRNNLFLPSISAMFHTSFRTWRNASLAFTLGASINTTSLDINSVFPGLSLMLGKSEKFVITAGPSLQKVNVLQSDYQLDKHYLNTDLPETIPTEKAFRIGAFIGFSYNLTKKQKDNFKLLKE